MGPGREGVLVDPEAESDDGGLPQPRPDQALAVEGHQLPTVPGSSWTDRLVSGKETSMQANSQYLLGIWEPQLGSWGHFTKNLVNDDTA